MPKYTIYAPRKKNYRLPKDATNAEKYWRIYIGPLDEIMVPYVTSRGAYPIPDTADACLWCGGRALIPLLPGTYIIRMAGKKSLFWKYNGIALCLENEFDAIGVRWKPNPSLGKIRGSYDRCIHSTKRQTADWKVFSTCTSPKKYLNGKHYRLDHKETCHRCPGYQFDRSLLKKDK